MDVPGIVALVLAAGGAVYLIRARMMSAAPPPASAAPSKQQSSARDQATMPPTLRPLGDRRAPKKKLVSAKTTAPATPLAKAEAEVASSKRIALNEAITPLAHEKDEAPPSTQPEEMPKTVPAPADRPSPIEAKLAPLVEANPKITPPPVTVPERRPNEGAADALPVIAVPSLESDEDDDVEATRVGRYERQSIRPPVEKLVFDEGADTDKSESAPLRLVVHALAQSDPGRRRKQNEDSFLVREEDGVYVVADGMGGHRGGEFASKIAVETIAKAFADKQFEAEAHTELPPAASELARAIQMANAAILAESSARPELKGMGTTLCAARFTEENRRLYIGHVGDSRCYRLRGGVMKQMTNDHTMADYGVTGPEGAHLSRALGVWPTVPIDVIMATPELDDVYLLCSDGLTKMLTNETIQTQLLHEEDLKAAATRLVMFANAHGGKDNITVVLLRVVSSDGAPPSAANPS